MKKFIYLLAIIIFSLSLTFGLASCIIVDSSGTGGSNNGGANTGGNGNSDDNNNSGGNGNTGTNDDTDGNTGTGGNDNGDDTENGGNTSSTMIFGKDVATSFVVGADSFIDVTELESAIYESCGSVSMFKSDAFEVTKGEIAVGDTNREITALAKTALDRELRSVILSSVDENFATKDTLGYGIFASDGALALVWKGEEAKQKAFDYFIDEYLSRPSLDSEPAISDFKVFSRTEHYEEIALGQQDAEWERVREEFIEFGCTEQEADACVAAVKNFYAIADERVYLWIANLYDPAVGGFYYSNSARDTEGFLPDVESTLQAFNLLKNNGMFDDFGDTDATKMQNAIPEEMQNKIISFVKGLQSDTDGYFHHPQWEGRDSSWTGRLNRDLNWSLGILEWFDESPNYSLPTSRPVSANALTGRLTVSRVTAVSRVVATAGADMYMLESPEAFRAYLESFDWEKSSYQAGSTTGTLSMQINAKGYTDIYEEFLNSKQNPENGLWEEGVYYASVNGLMKITACFNSLGIELRYADKAFESAIAMAKLTERDEEGFNANHIVDVYNPWYVMRDILINVERHGNSEMAERLRSTLVSEAAELITCSMQKTAPFRKDDGSFGYNWDYSPSYSSGAPTAVPGTVEGDVNGCVMSFGVLGNLLDTMGIKRPRRYYMPDYLVFMDEIEGLSPVIKSNTGVPAEVITFDEEPIGNTEPDAFSSVSFTEGMGETEYREGSNTDVVFHLKDTSTKSGTSIRLAPGGVPVGASRCVVEFDINVASSTDGVIYQIFVGSSYQLTLSSKDGYIRIGDSSAKGVDNDFGVSFKKGEWHTVRMEYYLLGDASSTITKIFLDGYLRAESDNFYGKLPDKPSKPDLSFHELHLYTLYDPKVDVYLDNIYASKDNELYTDEPIVNPYNVEDFENVGQGKLPSGFSSNLYDDTAIFEIVDNPYPDDNSDAEGKLMHFSAPAGGADFSKRIESLVKDGNAYVFEADIYIDDATMGEALTQTYFRSSSGSIFSLTFKGGSDETGKYVDLCILNPKNNTAKDALARIYLDEWVKLRIEYYRYQYEVGEDGNLWSGVKARVLIDGEEHFNGLCDYPNPNTLSKDAVSFFNYVLGGNKLDMYIDNMIFEVANITYVDGNGEEVADPELPHFPSGGEGSNTAAEEDHNGIFDFESAESGVPSVSGLSTSPNQSEYGNYIEIAEDNSGNKALKFITVPSEKFGNTAEFAASKLSEQDAMCQVVEFKALAERAAGNENFIQLYMYDSEGKLISSYNILFPKNLSGDIEISTRLSSSVSQSTVRKKLPLASGYIKFRFEHYESNGMTKIYVNDEFIGEGYAAYNGTGSSGKLASFKMTALRAAQFELFVDDVTVEAVEKAYTSDN